MSHRLIGSAAFLITCAIGAAGCSSSPPTTPTHSASASSPVASASPTGDAAAALTAFNGYITTQTTMYDNSAPENAIYQYASGDALNQLISIVEKNRTNGIVFSGTPSTRDVTITAISLQTTPPAATVSACFDRTNWTPVYMSNPSKSAEQPGVPLAPHPLTAQVQKLAGGWRVTEYTVNGSATC